MADGSTALILAARLAVEGMVEELIASHADVNAVDELGRLWEWWRVGAERVLPGPQLPCWYHVAPTQRPNHGACV